jgi:hypothetical protein
MTVQNDSATLVRKVLPPALCAQLRSDLDWAVANRPSGEGSANFHPRMFELSAANLSLFELEPIVSFAEALIDPNCHVVHNNSFTSPPDPGGKGGWHQDDRLHLSTADGKPLPPTVRLAVQLFTANYVRRPPHPAAPPRPPIVYIAHPWAMAACGRMGQILTDVDTPECVPQQSAATFLVRASLLMSGCRGP